VDQFSDKMETIVEIFSGLDLSDKINTMCSLIDKCSPFERGFVNFYNDCRCEQDEIEDDDEDDGMDITESQGEAEGSEEDGDLDDDGRNTESSREDESSDEEDDKSTDNSGQEGGNSEESSEDNSEDEEDDDNSGDSEVSESDNPNACPECFLPLCITKMRYQSWMPTRNKAPCMENHLDRKEMYGRYWGTLKNEGAFILEAYIQKKRNCLLQLPPHLRRRRKTVRDILPQCVINRVHKWYPNPENVPYMGHYWYKNP